MKGIKFVLLPYECRCVRERWATVSNDKWRWAAAAPGVMMKALPWNETWTDKHLSCEFVCVWPSDTATVFPWGPLQKLIALPKSKGTLPYVQDKKKVQHSCVSCFSLPLKMVVSEWGAEKLWSLHHSGQICWCCTNLVSVAVSSLITETSRTAWNSTTRLMWMFVLSGGKPVLIKQFSKLAKKKKYKNLCQIRCTDFSCGLLNY